MEKVPSRHCSRIERTVEGQEFDQPWVKPLIKAKFYVQCQCGLKDSTYFCIKCVGLPFCEICKTNKHNGHSVLQVYKASHQVAVKIREMREFWDTSDIQSYIINSKRIVYITRRQSRGQINHKGGEGHGSGNQCENCGWANLFAPAKYCSIECKLCLSSEVQEQNEEAKEDSASELKSDVMLQKSIQKLVSANAISASSSTTKVEWTSQTASNSHRKRSRKGIAMRSPST